MARVPGETAWPRVSEGVGRDGAAAGCEGAGGDSSYRDGETSVSRRGRWGARELGRDGGGVRGSWARGRWVRGRRDGVGEILGRRRSDEPCGGGYGEIRGTLGRRRRSP
jgi:hypothetical protein